MSTEQFLKLVLVVTFPLIWPLWLFVGLPFILVTARREEKERQRSYAETAAEYQRRTGRQAPPYDTRRPPYC